MTTRRLVEITPDYLRNYRTANGLSIESFWGTMGYSMSRGHAYETGRNAIPEHAKRLFTLQYIAGIPTDVKSADFRNLLNNFTLSDHIKLQKARSNIEKGMELLSEGMHEITAISKERR